LCKASLELKDLFMLNNVLLMAIMLSVALPLAKGGQLCQEGLGQSTCVGIGGDPIIGTKMIDLLALFEADPETDAIVMIGEIGGSMEIEAAHYAKNNIKKPIVGFIAGQTAPPGRRMGHAGAIISGADESASAKKAVMRSCGIHVVDSPAEIGKTVKALL
jgi:succinyl-CoA synthetase alpha subunit